MSSLIRSMRFTSVAWPQQCTHFVCSLALPTSSHKRAGVLSKRQTHSTTPFLSPIRGSPLSIRLSGCHAVTSSTIQSPSQSARFVQTAALPGRTNNTLGFYYKYRLHLIAGTAGIAILTIFGPWSVGAFVLRSLVVMLVGGLALIIYMFSKSTKSLVAYPALVRSLSTYRVKIEEQIGPFEVPDRRNLRSHSKVAPNGRPVLVYEAPLPGMKGNAFLHARFVQVPRHNGDGTFKKEWELDRARLDVATSLTKAKQDHVQLKRDKLTEAIIVNGEIVEE